jgi:hypothetical protein
MSATTQLLMEQLEELRNTIVAKQLKGEDVTDLITRLVMLQEKLLQATQTLNESKQILKG